MSYDNRKYLQMKLCVMAKDTVVYLELSFSLFKIFLKLSTKLWICNIMPMEKKMIWGLTYFDPFTLYIDSSMYDLPYYAFQNNACNHSFVCYHFATFLYL